MSVRPSPSGKWIIDYYPDGSYGKRLRRVIDAADREAAEAIERSLRSMAQFHDLPAPASKDQTVQDLFEDYLDHCRQHKSPRTTKDIERIWLAHYSRLLGNQAVGELTSAHLRHYKTVRMNERAIRGFKKRDGEKLVTNRRVGPRTINKELDYFKGFLKWCRQDLDMDLAPIHVDHLKAPRPIPIVLSPGEVQGILEAAGPVHRALILLLFSLGLRFSEAAGLRWEDVDTANDSLRVVQKGGGWKSLPLNAWTKEALEALERKGPYVFPSNNGSKPVGDIRKALRSICKRAGVTKRVTPHLFRHSIATFLMASGVNLQVIRRYLGHAQISSTTWYTNVEISHLREAVGTTLGAILTKNPAQGLKPRGGDHKKGRKP